MMKPGFVSGMRRRLSLPGALLCAAWLVGCGGGDDDDDSADDGTADDGDDGSGEISFSDDIAPIFAAKCNFCHHPNSATELDLTNPFGEEGMVGRRSIAFEVYGDDQEFIVDQGNPDGSFILTKVEGTDLDPEVEGGAMPLQIAPLDDAQVDDVVAWIEGGAADDATFDAVSDILGTDDQTLGRASGKCTLCHYEGSPPPRLNILDPFGEEGLVEVAASLGGVRVVPGSPDESVLIEKITGNPDSGEQMPFNPEPMTADEIATLSAWIEAGALEN